MTLLRHGLRLGAWFLLVVLGAGLAGGLLLAWRLSTGPIVVTELARRLITAAHLPVALRVDRVTLGWEGARGGFAAPLRLRFTDVTVADDAGRILDHLHHAAVALSVRALLAGRIAPFSAEASGGVVQLHRRPDGSVELAPGIGARPRAAKVRAAPPIWQGVHRLRLNAVDLWVDDEASGVRWGVRDAAAALRRFGDGAAIEGQLDATAVFGAASTAVAVMAVPRADGTDTVLRARFGAVDPTAFAALFPALRQVAVPVSGEVSATFDPSGRPGAMRARLAAGAGAIGGVPVRSAAVAVQVEPAAEATLAVPAGRLDVERADARLDDGATLSVAGTLAGGTAPGAALTAQFTVGGDAIPFATLRALWPKAVAHDARQWIVSNITDGTVHGARVAVRLASHDGLAGLGLADLGGGFAADGLVVHWLRPAPPITGGQAILRFDGPDALAIDVTRGQEGGIALDGSAVRITGLVDRDQVGDIALHVSGGLRELLALLATPRLHLLSTRAIPFTGPTGQVTAHVGVTLPLDAGVTIGQIGITVSADLAAVHLGNVVLGRALDGGTLHIDADNDGLSLKGTGRFAGLPVASEAAFSFRAGNPSDVVERADVSSRATPAAWAAAGLPVSAAAADAAGPIGLVARWRQRRDGAGSVVADVDLTEAALTLPIGWGKRAGQPGSVHVALGLDANGLLSLASVRASGPGLDVAAHGEVAGGRVRTVAVDRARIGRTRLHGQVDLPDGPGGMYRVVASGPVLDLAWRFAAPAAAPAVASPPTVARPAVPTAAGPRWAVVLRLGELDLAHGTRFGDVRARLGGAGTRVAAGSVVVAGTGALHLSLEPAPGGRTVALRTADAGRLLAAVDASRRVHGGALLVDAAVPDGAAPVAGTVTCTGFRIDHVPAAARFLRDLTVYGLADPAPAHGISVTRLVVPFTFGANGVLALQDARAWQPAVGLTAKGAVDTDGGGLALEGTIVPAYALNALPGRLPVIGRLFSPERGGGLFAATFRVGGTLAAPRFSVNLLAALVPGMLRDLLAR